MSNFRTNYGAGKVHEATPSRIPFHIVLACSGRTVEGAYATDEPVSCKACLKKQS